MANKKISELTTRTPSLSDLMLVGDPSSGYSFKCTVTALATIIETDIADGYVTLGTAQTISGAKTFSNNLTLTSVSNAGVDTDKFLVLSGSNVVNFRTGAEVLSDIGAQAALTNPITGTGTSGQVSYFNGTNSITSSPTFAFTPTSQLLVNNSVTAASAIARGINATPSLTAAANNDVLVGLDIAPTFTNGAFTGVSNLAARFGSNVQFNGEIFGTTNFYINGPILNTGNLFLRFSTVNSTSPIIASSIAKIGVWSSSSSYARFGHTSYDTGTNFGFLQQSNGDCFINGGNVFVSGGTTVRLEANGSERMRVFSTGNVLIQSGGTFTDAGFRLDVNGTARFGNTTIQTTNPLIRLVNNTATNDDPILYYQGGLLRLVDFSSANKGLFINTAVGNASLSMNGSANEATTMFRVHGSITAASAIARGVNLTTTLVAAANNDVLVGLDINPTFTNGAFTGVTNLGLRVTGNSIFSRNLNSNTFITISNTTAGNLSQATLGLVSDASAGSATFRKNSSTTGVYKILTVSSAQIYNETAGDIAILNDVATGTIKMAAGASSTSQMQIFANGNVGINQNTDAGFRLDVNGTARVQGALTVVPANNTTGFSISGSSLTGSNAQSLVSLSQTWNTTGNPTAIKLDVTNTASGANSYLLDLQVGGIPQFTVFKGGEIKTSSPAGGVAQTWKLGSVQAVTPTSPNRTIEVEVNGTTYYLHAKTTND